MSQLIHESLKQSSRPRNLFHLVQFLMYDKDLDVPLTFLALPLVRPLPRNGLSTSDTSCLEQEFQGKISVEQTLQILFVRHGTVPEQSFCCGPNSRLVATTAEPLSAERHKVVASLMQRSRRSSETNQEVGNS